MEISSYISKKVSQKTTMYDLYVSWAITQSQAQAYIQDVRVDILLQLKPK